MSPHSHRFHLTLLVILGLGVISPALRARDEAGAVARTGALEWQTTKAEVRLKPGAAGADAVFAFTNKSGKAVRIVNVASSCGCTAGRLDKQDYAPGERGEVKAHFDATGKRGKQVNWLTVSTDAGEPPMRLQFSVDIPELMSVTPRFLLWKRGEATPKSAEVRFDGAGRVEAVEVASDHPEIRAAVERTASAALWKLTVTPSAALPEGVTRAQITLKAKTETAGVQEARIFVQVR